MFNQIREPAADTTKPSREVHCCESVSLEPPLVSKTALALCYIASTISVCALERAEDLAGPESKKLYAMPRQSHFVPEGLGY